MKWHYEFTYTVNGVTHTITKWARSANDLRKAIQRKYGKQNVTIILMKEIA